MMPLTIRRRIEARLAKARERGEKEFRFQCAGVKAIAYKHDMYEGVWEFHGDDWVSQNVSNTTRFIWEQWKERNG